MTPSRRGHIRSILSTAGALLAISLGAPAGAKAAACAHASAIPRHDNLKTMRAATLCLLNAHRHDHGLRPLRAERRLARAAARYSRTMIRHNRFAHVGPDGSTLRNRVESAGYRGWRALAENIAWGMGSRSTPARIVAAWMRSPGHRRTILDAGLREVGVGIARGAPRPMARTRAATYTADFGAR